MPHLTRTIQRNLFETTLEAHSVSVPGPDYQAQEHVDTALTIATAMTSAEAGPYMARLPGQHYCPGMNVDNLPPRKRGFHY